MKKEAPSQQKLQKNGAGSPAIRQPGSDPGVGDPRAGRKTGDKGGQDSAPRQIVPPGAKVFDPRAGGGAAGDEGMPEPVQPVAEDSGQPVGSDGGETGSDETKPVIRTIKYRSVRSVYTESDTFFRSRMPKPLHWSVAWSDLMMTMFIFFVVMYIYASANQKFLGGEGIDGEIGTSVGTGVLGEGGGSIGEAQGASNESMSKLYDLTKQSLEAEDLAEFASIDLAPDQTVRIVLTGDLLFDPGRADLKPDARQSLMKIAKMLRQTPYVINVVGHTDSVPIHNEQFPTNWELSVVRATRVARFLIEQMELPANKFFVSGHSLYRPVMPNNSKENMAANRRVEIIVTRDMPQAYSGKIQALQR